MDNLTSADEKEQARKELIESINTMVDAEDIDALKESINGLSVVEIADILSHETDQEQTLLFSALSPELAFKTFDYLPTHAQRRLLEKMPPSQAATLLNEISPDDRTSFLQDLPKDVIDELVQLLPQYERIVTRTLLGYPEGSVGRLMTPDYLAVKIDWTIEEVLDHIQEYGHDSETLNVIYVIDNKNKLLDDIKLKDFLFVPRRSKVSSIATYEFAALSVYDSDEKAIAAFEDYDRIAMPVLDEAGVLLGIVTVDDILRLSSEEATEDIQKIGGMAALDEPYMQAPFSELMKKRAGWLTVLFVGELFTASAMGYFEEEISKAVILALFIPLIISSGGNSGSQASTLVIRALVIGEITLRDWWKIMKKEILSGVVLGSLLGTIGFLRVALWSSFSTIYGEHWLLVGVTLFISLIGVVMWGTLSGAMLPLLLKKCNFDPAVSSAPLVATLVDVTGILIYFITASFILKGTLL